MKRFSLYLEETDRYIAATPLQMRIAILKLFFLAFLVDVIVDFHEPLVQDNQELWFDCLSFAEKTKPPVNTSVHDQDSPIWKGGEIVKKWVLNLLGQL